LSDNLLGVIYQATDKHRTCDVAIKMEKPDKAKRILTSEYEFLKKLQGKKGIVPVYEFVNQSSCGKQNFFVMELKGTNLANFRKSQGRNFTPSVAIPILQQMLNAIENVHNSGIIHRDIKPSNFVMGRTGDDKNQVYLVDFGLAKDHLDLATMLPLNPRGNTDFRGTIPYASINAHMKQELSRRDDMWSFFFVILEFLDQPLAWKQNTNKDEVRDMKRKAFKNPPKNLFPNLAQETP
jgi:tau tubulin kinase